MCGIVALHRPTTAAGTEADETTARRTLERIAHLGPDGQGFRTIGTTVLAHARLSIVDLAGGDQPIGSDAGSWIVANGEICNHTDVRAGLDHPFRTDSDSEAALALVERLGVEGIPALMARVADPSHGPVRSFAAGIAGSSDLLAARRVAEHLGLAHTEIVDTADDAVEALPQVVKSIESYEPSLVRSAVPNYAPAREAARSVKVVLTGEGADELFAGYDHYPSVPSDELQDVLDESLDGLHHLNLQRCDRVTMAHSLEARVPFLDLDLVALARQIPIEWRLPGELGQEKALLRSAFDGWPPGDLLWWVKEQFGDGSGMADATHARIETLAASRDAGSTGLPGRRGRTSGSAPCRRRAAARSSSTNGCSPRPCRAPTRTSSAGSPPPEAGARGPRGTHDA
ncbi:hypothetical protein BKD30_13545 [Tersicoccus phoenicis]|uniref:Glutamine amidotransferase type-2 domain-containing protein n=1 Tax=Tersicoccus phoenicis TaxID=554083 RepID=A0A1R1L727_9MICC|nr:hypothetical protein BKD30_13545 [Tersicoccus phoenicis]